MSPRLPRTARAALVAALAATALSGPLGAAPAGAAAPGASADPSHAGHRAGVEITRLEVLNSPVYGGDIRLALETDRPSASGSIQLSARACTIACPAVSLGNYNGEGVLTVPTSTSPIVPRTFRLEAKVTKSDGSTATRATTVTVSDVPTDLSFGSTRLAPGEPLVVTLGSGQATRVEPTGSVRLTLPDGTLLGEQPVGPDRTASFLLTEGSSPVRASYAGDGHWAGDQATADVTIAKSVVTATGRLSEDDGTVTQGDAVSLAVTLAGSLPQVPVRGTGTVVAVAADGTETPIAQQAFDGAGPYRFDLSAFAADHLGAFDLVYSTTGNAQLAASRTVVARMTVVDEPAEPAASSTSAKGKASRQGKVTLTGTVASDPTATGRVEIREGRKVLDTVRVDADGGFRARLARFKPGRHTLTVAYLGDDAVAPSKGKVAVRVPRRR